jgi:hypothetical protein
MARTQCEYQIDNFSSFRGKASIQCECVNMYR